MRGRGRARSGAERIELERAAFLRGLRLSRATADQQLYREIMLEDLRPNRREKSQIQETLDVLAALRKAGLIEDPRDAGKHGRYDELIEAGLQVLPGLLKGVAQAQSVAAPPPAPPAPLAAPSPPAALTEGGEPPMSLVSTYLVHQLMTKTPAEAAGWLIAEARTRPLVDAIRQTPDDQMQGLIAGLSQQNPDLDGAVRWLLANWTWTAQVVAMVKATPPHPPHRPLAAEGL